ncbi:hypothetical protein [Sorangium sp. So ce117]|uniref:hypothetical protein n=1 Tax=Sorangium sp. So ce117 TaxID=3133277 RepID=UPI003F5DD9DC
MAEGESEHFTKSDENHASNLDKKKSDYASACNTGYINRRPYKDKRHRFEVHHILCEHSIETRFGYYKDDPTRDYIEDCIWITDWDINNANNLIGLPRNRRFRVDWASTSDTSRWTPLDVPSHQVDHNTSDGYTKEVSKWLQKNLWDTLSAAKKQHAVDAAKIKRQFVKGEKHFREELEERGTREPGKLVAWPNRFKEEYEKTWYHPFSMGKKPRHRHPGAPGKVATGLFAKLR